jgi:acyl carrier protein
MSQEQLQQLVIDWIKGNKRTSNHVEIAVDTELLGTGILDSFGFLDLIMHIESKTGLQIDLADADPGEFAVVGGLCNLALKSQAAQPCPQA